jgi:hypothetical protein
MLIPVFGCGIPLDCDDTSVIRSRVVWRSGGESVFGKVLINSAFFTTEVAVISPELGE